MFKSAKDLGKSDCNQRCRSNWAAPLLLYIAVMMLTTACRFAVPTLDAPMRTESDIAYAEDLWRVMEAEALVGDGAVALEPFFGGALPHGMILELASRDVTVDDHTGFLIVKKNYDGPDVSVENVSEDRSKFLSSITVMYRRENGYDSDNQDWFWVKYKPNGILFTKDMGQGEIAMAGRIGKGKTPADNKGCIYCHRSAGGGDYIFYPSISPTAGR